MIAQEKIETFKEELQLIDNEKVRNNVIHILSVTDDYFYHIPASSTGKYHPDFALGEGGLIRHTKAAVKIADCMLNLVMFSALKGDRDYIIAALILHCKKNGDGEQYTRADHPILAANFIYDNCIDVIIGGKIAELVKTHMGQFNTDFKTGKVILPPALSPVQKFVHLADYLASRKFLNINF